MSITDALNPITQTGRLLAVTTALPFDILLINNFVGSDRVSSPFSFQVELLADRRLGKDQLVTVDKLIGDSMTIQVQVGNNARFFNGIVKRFNKSGHDDRFTRYRAELVPWFSLLTLTSDCRIFQNKTVPAIITDLLEELGFKGLFDFNPSREYTVWDYCVQYRESDFNFISRLMEQEGIFYYFKHSQDKHVLVMGDDPSAHEDCNDKIPFRFLPEVGIGEREDTILSLESTHELVGSKWTLRDYHFEMPQNGLQVELPNIVQVKATENLDIFDYPGEYAQKFNEQGKRLDKVRDEGNTIVKLRMQEDEVNQHVLNGTSHARRFSSGLTFSVTSSDPDLKGPFVLTSVQHSGVQSPGYLSNQSVPIAYENSFTCIPKSVPFRPARKTPKPVITGPQTAKVVDETPGPDAQPKEEILVDKFGRVRVRFPWDREGRFSCLVRVAQPWAGKGWGHQWFPRIGDEVIVDFLEGDPDCPIIIGSVYNADNPPIYDLPAHKTQSGIKTRSVPKGTSDNYNEIRFEDKKDHEQVFINAEKDMDLRVENESREFVGANRHLIVTKDQLEEVDGDKHSHVKGKHVEGVDGEESLTVKGDQMIQIGGGQSLQVGQSMNEKVGQTWAKEAGQTIHIKAGMTLILEAGMQLSLKGPGGFVDIGPAGVTIQGTMVLINSGGAAGSGPDANPQSPESPKAPDKADDGTKFGKA